MTSFIQIGSDIIGPSNNSLLGESVSISSDGNTIVIGAPTNNSSRGLVQVYNYINDTWRKIGNDIRGSSTGSNFGRSVSISSDGNTIVIGAPTNNSSIGLVRVYNYSNNTWTRIGSNITGSSTGSEFGRSVSISSDGNTIVIGAPTNNSLTGLVRVYNYIDNTWTQIGYDIIGSSTDSEFGRSVSISSDGNRIVIGAPTNNSSTGLVQVYNYSNNTWRKIGNDIIGPSTGSEFGRSVSMSSDGNTIVIGAPTNNSSTGLVQVYNYSNNTWTQIGSDIIGPSNNSSLGESVSISSDGNTIVIGAPTNNFSTGLVQVYNYSNNTWTQIGNDIIGSSTGSEFGQFGRSVSISSDGNTIVIGAPTNNSLTGLVQVYNYNPTTETVIDVSSSVIKTYGNTPFYLYPSSNSPAPFTYISSNTSVASVSSNGLITINDVGTSIITVSQAEVHGYTDASSNTSLTINNSTPSNPTNINTSEQLEYFLITNSGFAEINNNLNINYDLVNESTVTKILLNTLDSEFIQIYKN